MPAVPCARVYAFKGGCAVEEQTAASRTCPTSARSVLIFVGYNVLFVGDNIRAFVFGILRVSLGLGIFFLVFVPFGSLLLSDCASTGIFEAA